MNVWTFSGNLTADPEVKEVGDTTIGSFTVAVNYRAKEDGEWVDKVMFVRCTVFGNRTKALQWLHRGSRTTVSGVLTTRQWTTKEGQVRTELEVAVNDFDLPPKSDSMDAPGPPASAPARQSSAPARPTARPAAAAPAAEPGEAWGALGDDDGLPF